MKFAYRIEIKHPESGWIRVGLMYRDRKQAQGWVSFVRAYWNCETRIVKVERKPK